MFAENYPTHRIGIGVGLLVATIWGIASAQAEDADSIRPYSENPFYWQYKGKPVLLLGGSWQDNLFNHPTGLAEHLDLLAASGGNYVRNTMSHRNVGNVFAYAQRDGKFDLDEFNEEYWQRFERFLRLTKERDIIVQIEVFDIHDYFRDHQSYGGWSKHPFNPGNNMTYTPEESGMPTVAQWGALRPPPSRHPFWTAVPALENNELVLRYQQGYVDKILSISLKFPNVLYCIQNESTEDMAFSDYWADYIHQRAKEAGRTVYVTDMRHTGDPRQPDQMHILDNPQRYTFVDIAQVGGWYSRILLVREYIADNPRPITLVKLYNRQGEEESVARMWRSVLAGAAAARFHRPHPLETPDAQEATTEWGLGLSPRARVTIRSARMLTDAMNLFACKPRNDLLSARTAGAFCLAEPGKQYAVYFSNGGSVTLDLSDAPEELTARWINIQEAKWTKETAIRGGKPQRLTAPGDRHWAVAVLPR